MKEINTNRVSNQDNLSRREVPAHSAVQRDRVLRLLYEAKSRGQGLRKEDAIFTFRLSQVAARIHELERMGYVIRHESEPGQRFVTFFLVGEPECEKPLPTYQPRGADPRQASLANSPDWYVRTTGQERPAPGPADPGPLFQQGDTV